MGKQNIKRLDESLFDLLTEAADNSLEDCTVWLDAATITFALMNSYRPGARRVVRQRLEFWMRQGKVERRKFDAGVGWRLLKMAGDK